MHSTTFAFSAIFARKISYSVALAALFASSAQAHHEGHIDQNESIGDGADRNASVVSFEPIVITAPTANKALEVSLDPKKPQQPLPANDGASFLKNIPGVSVTRKGGTDGDPMFRGAAASRLNILLDGAHILGGCGGRMDPPTAYVFPESYDRVTLLKGPQSVIYGSGASAGSVLFERKRDEFGARAGAKATLALTAASFDRLDQYADIKAGNSDLYVQSVYSFAKSGDYEDGDGEKVHSKYERESVSAALGWTPDRNTLLEVSGIRSEAVAAYADRGMDGGAFDRENYAIKFDKSEIGKTLYEIKAQAYHNYIDHIMDNFSMRPNSGMGMVSNPDRKTEGGRLELTFLPADSLSLIAGADMEVNLHRGRSGAPQGSAMNPYDKNKFAKNVLFKDYGLFGELAWQADAENKLIVGARADAWEAEGKENALVAAGKKRDETLFAGFIRYEFGVLDNGLAYAGFGHSERAPDFWEVIKQSEKIASNYAAFNEIDPEKTNQFDIGFTYKSDRLQTFVSTFYNKATDYILIDAATRSIARNIDATTFGGEAGLDYRLSDSFKVSTSLAYTRGENDSDNKPLGQIPPFESRVGLDFDNGTFSAGAAWRYADAQTRYAKKQGNIVGQDIGSSKSFSIASLNVGYRLNKTAEIALGVDNLFDKTYAEFISKAGSNVAGYEQTKRINEPGRTVWLQARIALN
ncbi:MAG: TonB-dependent copper receptor [Helicobacteraceae bacterium]|jgi:iron complex outermembrane receptor protein|nr:TonB-dependent copper receptor [Helicobacteraceae bacterium]